MNNDLVTPQNKLGKKGLILLLFFLNMTGPMSTDLYLSGFPNILIDFNTTAGILNYTLVGFFVSFAVGMLFIGPMSDKVGRKPVLITGIITYGLASYFCSLAANIEMLITLRILQALGAGGMIAVSTAMVKDSFSHEERPKIIATLQMLGAFAPTVAPLIGAQIINYFSWRVTFEVLAFLAFGSLIISLFLDETLQREKRLQGNILQSVFSLKDILINKPFMIFLLSMGGSSLIYMSFLSISSYIYIEWFELTRTEYSVFFAINSLILIIGPRLFLYARTIITGKQIVQYSFGTMIFSGILLLTIGTTSPYLFLIAFAPITFSSGFLRSFASSVLLGQDNMNAGGVASIINFSNTGLGAIGMMLGTLAWSNYIHGLGYVILIAMTFSLSLWFYFQREKFKLKGV